MTKPYPSATKGELMALAKRWKWDYYYLLEQFCLAGPRKRVRYTRAMRLVLATPDLTPTQRQALTREGRATRLAVYASRKADFL